MTRAPDPLQVRLSAELVCWLLANALAMRNESFLLRFCLATLLEHGIQLQTFLQVMKIGPGEPKTMFLSEEDMKAKFPGTACTVGVSDADAAAQVKRAKTSQDSWQTTHMTYYEETNVPWPPPRSAKYSFCAQLSQREFEIVYLADTLFGHHLQERGATWNIDVNDDMKRTFGPVSEKLKNPWRSPLLMTLVGSSQVVCRVYLGYDISFPLCYLVHVLALHYRPRRP